MNRRALLQSAFVLGLGIRQDDQASGRPREGDFLVKADDPSKTPLKPADIPLGAKHTLAWAMDPADMTVRSGSRLNQLLLVRLATEALSPETLPRAAAGVVAYTAICTHNGCDIDDWLAAEQLLSCSCHSSSFDPKDGGRVVDGPAPRVLPALPLKLVDATLVVAKPFTSPVGYEKG
jgi:rieske iron-sulfur protein